MYQTLSAKIKNGRIALIDKAKIPEGAHVLVTVMQADEGQFWRKASQTSLNKIWANKDDDAYEKLISK
jgi:hypothetical protein